MNMYSLNEAPSDVITYSITCLLLDQHLCPNNVLVVNKLSSKIEIYTDYSHGV